MQLGMHECAQRVQSHTPAPAYLERGCDLGVAQIARRRLGEEQQPVAALVEPTHVLDAVGEGDEACTRSQGPGHSEATHFRLGYT